MLNRPKRRSRAIGSSVLAFSLAPILVGAPIEPARASVLRGIGEWVVACDNLGRCSVLNVGPSAQQRRPSSPASGLSRICVHREPGPGTVPTIHVTLREFLPREPSAGRQPRLLRMVGPGGASSEVPLTHRGSEHWEVPSIFVPGVVAALVDGGEIHVVTRAGGLVERIATEGFHAAMALTDDNRGQPSGVSPVDRGGDARPEALVTATLPPLPPGQAPSATALALRRAACGTPGFDATTGYRLLGDRTRFDRSLWVTPCDRTNGPPRSFFVIENHDGASAPVVFPGRDGAAASTVTGMIDFPQFAPERGLLREAWYAPVVPPSGEACVIERLWGWTGRAFELAEERRSLACIGSGTIWRAITFARSLVTATSAGEPALAASFATPCERRPTP